MKKTLTVNLSQRVYHIDEDAYNMLNDYLDSLREILSSDESRDEIIMDIENRIGEICSERINANRQVVTVDDITEIITQLGKPEQFDLTDDDTETPPAFSSDQSDKTVPPYTPPLPSQSSSRRLYRDMHNKMIGGVCSGIGAYIGIDPTWIRLLFILFAFLYGTTIIVYIFLWIIIPPAMTVTSQMRMNGMQPTMENIGRAVNQAYTTARDKVNTPESRSLLHRLCNIVVTIVAALFKAFLIILLIVAVPILTMACFAVVMAIIGLVIACIGEFAAFASAIPLPFFDTPKCILHPLPGLITVIGVALTVGVPVFAIIWGIGRSIFSKNKTTFTQATTLTLLVLWSIGIALTCYGNLLIQRYY